MGKAEAVPHRKALQSGDYIPAAAPQLAEPVAQLLPRLHVRAQGLGGF